MSALFWFPRWLLLKSYRWLLFWVAAMPIVFLIDRHLTQLMQLMPALAMWWLFMGGLLTRDRRDRLLLITLVIVATVAEITASLLLHWYTYRLHNIPLWIPPGHGIIFLTALLCAELPVMKTFTLQFRLLASFGTVAYAVRGLIETQTDWAGALFGAVFLIWLWTLGQDKGRFYVALWFWVGALEIAGVSLGAWHWSTTMPVLRLSEASPPSGIVGAYGAFDLVAFTITALFVRPTRSYLMLRSRLIAIDKNIIETERTSITGLQ